MLKKLDINLIIDNAVTAAEKFRLLDQKKTDNIVTEVFKAGFNNRIKLAKMAFKETNLGIWKDKVIKNAIATKFVYEDIINLKTAGIISTNSSGKIIEIAQPIGPIFAITPVTNPTSTVLFKILIAMKSRNPIIIRPHGAAKKCSIEAAKICYEAALNAGAPKDCIQWIKRSTKEETIEFMGHKKTALILATGSVSLVRAAYSSGNPAIGVGPGNVPVFFGKTADIDFGVDQIILSKTFDNGTICASEQALILQKYNSDKIIKAFKKRNAYFLSKEEIKKIEKIAFNKKMKVMHAAVIGQSAYKIAEMAGIKIPKKTNLLIAHLSEVGMNSPLSFEILAPILAMYIVDDFGSAIEFCKKINHHGGLGHTVSIFSKNEKKIRYFAQEMNAGRILINTPASQGALGGTYNSLSPSMTLACGSGGKNITTDNISARHLLNIQRIARRDEHKCIKHFTDECYLNESIKAEDLECKKDAV